jgi:hypothetical protein
VLEVAWVDVGQHTWCECGYVPEEDPLVGSLQGGRTSPAHGEYSKYGGVDVDLHGVLAGLDEVDEVSWLEVEPSGLVLARLSVRIS